MGNNVKPVQPTEIKDKKIAREVIAITGIKGSGVGRSE